MVAEVCYMDFSRPFHLWKRERSRSYVTDEKGEKGRKGRVNNKSNYFKKAYERLCLFTAQRRSFLYFGQPAHAKSLQLGMFPLVAMPYLCRMNNYLLVHSRYKTKNKDK